MSKTCTESLSLKSNKSGNTTGSVVKGASYVATASLWPFAAPLQCFALVTRSVLREECLQFRSGFCQNKITSSLAL